MCALPCFGTRVAVIPATSGSHEQKGPDRGYRAKDLLQSRPVIRQTERALLL
jgi:hypothetical protein